MRYAPQNLITIATVASYVKSRVDSHNKQCKVHWLALDEKANGKALNGSLSAFPQQLQILIGY